MKQTIEKLKALAEPTRLTILRMLVERGGELCVCEIEAALGKPQYAVSRSLSLLKSARLVNERRQGKRVYYSIDASNPVNALVGSFVGSLEPGIFPTPRNDGKPIACDS